MGRALRDGCAGSEKFKIGFSASLESISQPFVDSGGARIFVPHHGLHGRERGLMGECQNGRGMTKRPDGNTWAGNAGGAKRKGQSSSHFMGAQALTGWLDILTMSDEEGLVWCCRHL